MGTVSVQVFQLVAAGAGAAGVAPPVLLAAAGVDPGALADPDGRLPRTLEARLWQEAARLTGDEAFGLHLAERSEAAGFGALGFAVRSSATLGEAYARVMRFVRVVVSGPTLTLASDRRVARIRHAPPRTPPPPSRYAIEFLLATLVVVARRNGETAFVPRAASFRHAAPARLDEHRRMFGPGLRFSADEDELVIERERLDRPQAHAEPALAGVLDRQLAAQLADLPAEDASFLDRTRGALCAELEHGEPTVEAIAARLHMSPRSLQRRLQQEGSSLSSVLDRLRADLAVRYLEEARVAIGEVAFRLGFSDATTFHRAFRRWTGQTPAEYRRGRAAGPQPAA
jgi:AraC-like DNA-binding protein